MWWPARHTDRGEVVDRVAVIAFQAPLLFANAETFKRGMIDAIDRQQRELSLMVLEASGIADNALVLAGDTVVAVGRRILPKAETMEEANVCLRLLSGRNHRVFTAISMITPGGATRRRLVETRLRFKRLSNREIESYLASAEWRDKAGGYAIQGIAGAFVVKLIGSYSAVVGLPLNETVGLLAGEGYPVHFNWLNQSTLTAV